MARKASTFSFSRTIAAKREDLARARLEITQLADMAEVFKPAYAIANAIAAFAAAQGFNKYVRATPSTWINWDGTADNRLDVRFEGNVDSLRDGPVPAICEAILGFGLDAKETSDYAADWCATRTFKFEGAFGGVRMDVRFEANVNDGSDQCRKVQVGTEIREVAKYEIVCA